MRRDPRSGRRPDVSYRLQQGKTKLGGCLRTRAEAIEVEVLRSDQMA